MIIHKVSYTDEEKQVLEKYRNTPAKCIDKNLEKQVEDIREAARLRYILSLHGNPSAILADIKEVMEALSVEDFVEWQDVSNETDDDLYILFCHFAYVQARDSLEALRFYDLPLEKKVVNIMLKAASKHFPKPDLFDVRLFISNSQKRLSKIQTETRSGHQATLYFSRGFRMMRQGVGVNAFTTQATSKRVKATVDAFTGKATLEFKDIKVLIEEYSKHKNLTVPTMQLLDFMDIILTESGMKSPIVEFSLDEYMQHRKLSDRKSAKEQIKSAIEELKSISLEWEEKRGKRQIEYKFMNIADSGYVSRNGKITFTFGTTFFGVLKTYSVMSYPEQLGQINSRLNPNSYNFLRKISEHKNMNAGKKNENIITVETLLSCANALPSYDEVMASDRHISSRIIEPFLRDMNALVPTLQWEFCKKNTGEMLSDDEVELDYYTFKNLNVRITWNNYPDQTKKLERKATSTNSGKGRFHLRRKILSK